MRLIGQLRATDQDAVADAAVIVVMRQCPSTPPGLRAVQRQARATVGDLVTVPYDRGLAQPGPIDARHLRPRTRKSLVDVAAAVLARCPADPDALAARDGERPDGTAASIPNRSPLAVGDVTANSVAAALRASSPRASSTSAGGHDSDRITKDS
jgi:hypothetical protein